MHSAGSLPAGMRELWVKMQSLQPREPVVGQAVLTHRPASPSVGQAAWHRPRLGTTVSQLPGFSQARSCFPLWVALLWVGPSLG